MFSYLCGMKLRFEDLVSVMTAPRRKRSELFRKVAGMLEGVNQPTDFEDWTLLHWTAHWGLARETKWLLKRGANPFLRTARGETPLEIAALMGRFLAGKALLQGMLQRATQNPHEYQLLKEELADWHFYYKVGWLPYYFIDNRSHGFRGPHPKLCPYRRIILMVLTSMEEVFVKIQDEEEKDRLYSHREKHFLSWDPMWELREITPSPISYLLGEHPPLANRGYKTINMRNSYRKVICYKFSFGFFRSRSVMSSNNTAKSIDTFFEEIGVCLEKAQRFVSWYGHIKCSGESDCTEYIECAQAFRENIEKSLRGEGKDLKSLLMQASSDDFVWSGASALYLPGEEKTLPEEKYRRAMSRIKLEQGRLPRNGMIRNAESRLA